MRSDGLHGYALGSAVRATENLHPRSWAQAQGRVQHLFPSSTTNSMSSTQKGPQFDHAAFLSKMKASSEQLMFIVRTKSERRQYERTLLRKYNRLRRCYLSNRVPRKMKHAQAYNEAVETYALQSKKKMHEHCQTLLQAVANPMMLEPSLAELRPKVRLSPNEQEMLACKYGKWSWLRGLQAVLLNQQFTTGKYQKYKIPKPGKQGCRTIEVPDTGTRVVAKTMLKVLNPLFDPRFYPLSIGFRPGRSPLHGLAAAEQLVQRGLTHWVKCDIRDAFGQIPKPMLVDVLKSRLKGSSIMWLIEEVLGKDRKRGIPQGVAISPLAMNVYLDHVLDQWWAKNFPDTCLVRYADDILIACPSRRTAIDACDALDLRTRTVGMPIKEKLTDALFDLNRGDVVDWLGFQIRLTQNELDFSLGVNSWNRLEFKLQEVKVRKEKGETYTQDEINSIGFGRVLEKAVAIEQHQVAAVAQQIRELAAEANLGMVGFTGDAAHKAWSLGQKKWQQAREDVIPWLPAA